jgi:hypothetical protein
MLGVSEKLSESAANYVFYKYSFSDNNCLLLAYKPLKKICGMAMRY